MNVVTGTGIGGPGGFIMYDVGMPGVLGPTVINSYSVLGIPPYWRAMRFISENMASFPRSIALDDVDQPHRLDNLIKRKPNPLQTACKFYRTLFFHRSHYGNAYARIVRDSLFNAAELHIHPPEFSTPFILQDDDGHRQLWYLMNGRQPKFVPAQDVIHLVGLSYDGMLGFNPVVLLSEAFERSRTTDRFMTRFLVKGTVLRGSVEIPAGVSKDQQKTIVDWIQQQFKGADADRDVIVLSDGAKLNNNTLSPDQSKLIEISSYTTKQIAQITGVPPVFLFDNSEAKYNNTVEQAYDMVVRDLFRPLIEQDEAEFTDKLLTPAEQEKGMKVKFDPNALTRGDTKTISDTAIAQKNAGVISANEARKRVGEKPTTNPADDKLQVLGTNTPPPKESSDEQERTPKPE